CLWAGLASLNASGASRAGWLASSITLGLLGFTVREYAIVAPLAGLAVDVWSARSRPRALRGVLSVVVLFLAVAAALFLWRAGLGVEGSRDLGFRGRAHLVTAARSAFTLALLALPVAAVAAVCLPRAVSRRPVVVLTTMTAVGVLG